GVDLVGGTAIRPALKFPKTCGCIVLRGGRDQMMSLAGSPDAVRAGRIILPIDIHLKSGRRRQYLRDHTPRKVPIDHVGVEYIGIDGVDTALPEAITEAAEDPICA